MIIKILICHPDAVFLDFMRQYLALHGFEVKGSADCIEGFTQLIHFKPQLVIINKEFKGLDAKGFLTKKNATKAAEAIPVFLIGAFTGAEIVELKTMNARAFMSNPVNPVIVVERIMNLFSIPLPPGKKTMPMLMDINARGNIIIAQLEGNFEAEKLELFNYYLRSYCVRKEIASPRLLLIVPSLYPESVTAENVDRLFRFTTYPELKIEDHAVKVLTTVPELVSLLKANADYARFETATDFLSALQALQIDFDKKKTVPVEYIKLGSIYIFDLFDNSGKRVIPAHTPVTEKIIAFLIEKGYSSLSYFSDLDLDEIERDALEFDQMTGADRALEILSAAFEPVITDLVSVSLIDEKLLLFLRKLKDRPVLVVSYDHEVRESVARFLDVYFHVDLPENGFEIVDTVRKKQYILVFLDDKIGHDRILDLLRRIRLIATRRKTSVIILAEHINKIDVLRYKDSGTDNIIVRPFSQNRLFQKIYASLDADRRY